MAEASGAVEGAGGALPEVVTDHSPEQICALLDSAAMRGKLPGYESSEAEGELFRIGDFGTPFEGVLSARYSASAGEGGAGRLRFEARLKPIMPVVFAVVLAATVWPGVWLTDSLLHTYFGWYNIPTWWWYLPLTVPFCPWVLWVAVKRSRASADAEGRELIGKVAAILGGRVEGGAASGDSD